MFLRWIGLALGVLLLVSLLYGSGLAGNDYAPTLVIAGLIGAAVGISKGPQAGNRNSRIGKWSGLGTGLMTVILFILLPGPTMKGEVIGAGLANWGFVYISVRLIIQAFPNIT